MERGCTTGTAASMSKWNDFLNALASAICPKHEKALKSGVWTVSPALYSLWSLTSHLSVALLADCINESGSLRSYGSLMRRVYPLAESALGTAVRIHPYPTCYNSLLAGLDQITSQRAAGREDKVTLSYVLSAAYLTGLECLLSPG